MTDLPAPIQSAAYLVKAGLQPIILQYIAESKGAEAIVSSLRDEHGVVTDVTAVRQFLELAGDTRRVLQVGMKREMSRLHRDSLIQYQEHWDAYRELSNQSFAADGDAEANRIDLLKFHAGELRLWWDRVGRFHAIGEAQGDTGQKTTNIIQIIADESRAGRLGVQAFEALLQRVAKEEGTQA